MGCKLRAWWNRVAGWMRAKWAELHPGEEAARGARWGAGLLVLAMAFCAGSHVRAGLTTAGDMAVVAVAAP